MPPLPPVPFPEDEDAGEDEDEPPLEQAVRATSRDRTGRRRASIGIMVAPTAAAVTVGR